MICIGKIVEQKRRKDFSTEYVDSKSKEYDLAQTRFIKELELAKEKFEWEKENECKRQKVAAKKEIILRLIDQKLSPASIKKCVETLDL